MEISAAVLAGGLSRRFLSDKTQLTIEGKNIVVHIVNRLKDIFPSVVVVADRKDRVKALEEISLVDIFPRTGPMSGIYTGLLACKSEWLFVIGGDMPFVSESFIRWGIRQISPNADAVIPKDSKGLQPLCAFYRKSCLNSMKKNLEAGNYRIVEIRPEVYFQEIDVSCFPEFSQIPYLFHNINTPEDWENCLALCRQKE